MESCRNMSHVTFREKHNLPTGERFPHGLVDRTPIHRAKALISLLKENLEEGIHEYSGAIFGDIKSLKRRLRISRAFIYKRGLNKKQPIYTLKEVENREIVLSGASIEYDGTYYYVLSNHNYWTEEIPSYSYKLLCKSRSPITLQITRAGNVERYTRGRIVKAVEA